MRRPVFALTLALLALLFSLASCHPRDSAGHAAVYTLRGEVVKLPAGDNLLTLHHEAIDGFCDQDGRVAGMDSMTMPFPLARDVPLAGLGVGDRVAVTLRVDWTADPGVQITALTRLPAAAPPLVFRAARPAGKAS